MSGSLERKMLGFAPAVKVVGGTLPDEAKVTDDNHEEKRSVADIMGLNLPPMKWFVPELIPEGLTVLAGRPKVGKSWLTYAIALSVTAGKPVLGVIPPNERCGCLYYALEDSDRRIQRRTVTLDAETNPPKNLFIEYSLLGLKHGGLDQMRRFLDNTSDIGMVILDTFGHVMPEPKPGLPLYQHDVQTAAKLVRIARDYRIAMIVVHHERKSKEGIELHPADLVSGTYGLSGSADTLLILTTREKKAADAILHVTGRDVEERELALQFNAGAWALMGDGKEFGQRSRRQHEILSSISSHGPCTPMQMAERLKVKYETAKVAMWRMAQKGLLTSVDGVYYIGTEVSS